MAKKGCIESKIDYNKMRKELQLSTEGIIQTLVYRMQMIGEAAVKKARDCGSYQDQTGNLRSSIGYCILVDGEEYKSGGFEKKAGRIGDGSKGVADGKAFLDSLRSQYGKGIVLIVVAGMNYATYVESVHHKDVLTSAELEAERMFKMLITSRFGK